jgi:L-threonylcarbamoyladenylate synthase
VTAPIVDAADDLAGAVAAARVALGAGQVVGIPTDTVYGLAVDPWAQGASEAVFAIKGRPRRVVLPVLVAGVEQAHDLGDIGPVAFALMRRWWPGALTIVVAARPDLGADLGGDGTTVGLRCPAHLVALALCAGGPLATTSANLHGEPPVTTAAELAASLPGVALVVDGGPCRQDPSSVVDTTGPHLGLLRAGSVPWEDILASTRA